MFSAMRIACIFRHYIYIYVYIMLFVFTVTRSRRRRWPKSKANVNGNANALHTSLSTPDGKGMPLVFSHFSWLSFSHLQFGLSETFSIYIIYDLYEIDLNLAITRLLCGGGHYVLGYSSHPNTSAISVYFCGFRVILPLIIAINYRIFAVFVMLIDQD